MVQPSLAIVGVIGQQNADEAASGVLAGLPNAGADFPVHMLSLPGAGANQHDGHGRIGYVIVAYLLSHSRGFEVGVIYVSRINRPVHDAPAHHAHEPFLVPDILLVKADENFRNYIRW